MLTEQIAYQLIKVGIAAPSGDNLQPWKFYWDNGKDSIDIAIRDLDVDQSLFNIIYNGQKLVSLITIGTAVENMRVCAGHLGYRMQTTYFPQNSPTKSCVVRTEFIQDESAKKFSSSLLYPFISKRCTNRKIYDGNPINKTIADHFAKEVQNYKNIQLYWIENQEKRQKLAQFSKAADQIMFETQGLLRPLMDSIRWNKKQAEKYGDGLPIETLELDWMKSQSFRMFACWPLVKFLNHFGLSLFASRQAKRLINSSSALALLSLEVRDDLNGYIQGGEAFEKLWLLATSYNISLQPMVGILFLINRVELLNGEGLCQRHIEKVRAIKEELFPLLNIKKTETPLILCRLGYAPPPSSKTLRQNNTNSIK